MVPARGWLAHLRVEGPERRRDRLDEGLHEDPARVPPQLAQPVDGVAQLDGVERVQEHARPLHQPLRRRVPRHGPARPLRQCRLAQPVSESCVHVESVFFWGGITQLV